MLQPMLLIAVTTCMCTSLNTFMRALRYSRTLVYILGNKKFSQVNEYRHQI